MDEHADVSPEKAEEAKRERRWKSFVQLQFERVNGRKPTDPELRSLLRAKRRVWERATAGKKVTYVRRAEG